MYGMKKQRDLFSNISSIFRYTFIILFCFFAHANPRDFDVNKNYYEILGVSENATQKEIKFSYSRLAQQHHPDKGGDTKIMAELNQAKKVLFDPKLRALYNTARSRLVHQEGSSAQTKPTFTPDIHLKESRFFSFQLQPTEDPYRVLGVERDASEKLIIERYEFLKNKIEKETSKEFRRQGQQGRGLNPEKISELNRLYSAYRVLSNPEWRNQYDSSQERTITIEGRLFVFEDKANQESLTFFESKNGEVFDFHENEERGKLLVRNTLFAPPENQTSMDTVIKVAGEKLELKLVQLTEIKEPVERQGEAEQRRVPLAELRQQLEEFRQRLNDKWDRLKSTAQDGFRSSIFVQRLSISKVVAKPSPRAMNFEPSALTWGELYRMTHSYSENSTKSLGLKSTVFRAPGQTLNFYVALGAFMFVKTYFDSATYDGVQIDPQWAQTLMAQMTSPVGVFSFVSFVVAAGLMNGLLESHINQLIKSRYNQSKSGINKGIASKGDVADEHRKTNRNIDRRVDRTIKFIRFSRTAFALSAGMMVSAGVQEFFTDPNIKGCWAGIQNKENRSFNFIETCDTAYSEWESVFKSLVAIPSVVLLYKHIKNKLSPFERKIAKGILGIVTVMFITSGFDDSGKLGDWVLELPAMIAAGYIASGVTKTTAHFWGSTKNVREGMGRAMKGKWDEWTKSVSTSLQELGEGKVTPFDKLKSKLDPKTLNKLDNAASKLNKLGKLGRLANWPSWLIQGTLSIPHLVIFFGAHELLHPLTAPLKNYFMANDIVDQKIQINSYMDNSVHQTSDSSQDQKFEFWEGNPEPDCSMSNPEEMGYLEILEEAIFNSTREDCPGRFFSHQLSFYSNLLFEWRFTQFMKFHQLNQSWKRDITETRLWYETSTAVLFQGGLLSVADGSEEENSRKGWEDILYHNVRDDYKIDMLVEQEQEEKAVEAQRQVISENEVCRQALEKKSLCNGSPSELEQSDLQTTADDLLETCAEAEELINSCNELIMEHIAKVGDEMERRYLSDTGDESDEEEDSNNERENSRDIKRNYLTSAFMKFKWAVYQIDQYIDTQDNKNQFQFNNSVLSSPSSRSYLTSEFDVTASLSEEELLGSLRELFNAVDYREADLSKYYSSGQIARCTRDINCEDILRVRAVSAGVDLLNQMHRHIIIANGSRRYNRRHPIKYSNLIRDIMEVFKNGDKNPRTYTTPSSFNLLSEAIGNVIGQHRQAKEEETGMFSFVIPAMDSLPSLPMEYIVYNMVCGDDLDQFSLPSEELSKCTSQDDLEELVEQLPSFEDGGITKPYMFKIPKLIKGPVPNGICEKDYKTTVYTSFNVNGREYEGLLEFVLDPHNIKTNIQIFWEEKVEKQYALLMGCFENQYRNIYTNHFMQTVNSEETYTHSRDTDSNGIPVGSSIALGYADLDLIPSQENIVTEIPKGPLESMMNQADYFFGKLKEIHQYPENFESINCERGNLGNLDEKSLIMCKRQMAIKDTFEQLPGICADLVNLDQNSSANEMQETADMSIECFREMVLDLFEHMGSRIKRQQCLTPAISGFRNGELLDMDTKSWGEQFDYILLKMQYLVSIEVNTILMSDGTSTREQCFKGWCHLYNLPFRDTATVLIVRHLSSIFDELINLHGQVSLFSNHVAVAEECGEDYWNNSDSDTLIKQSIDLYLESIKHVEETEI